MPIGFFKIICKWNSLFLGFGNNFNDWSSLSLDPAIVSFRQYPQFNQQQQQQQAPSQPNNDFHNMSQMNQPGNAFS